jgi:hypothetical protein
MRGLSPSVEVAARKRNRPCNTSCAIGWLKTCESPTGLLLLNLVEAAVWVSITWTEVSHEQDASLFFRPREGRHSLTSTLEKTPVSDLCDDLGIGPNLFYRWQKEFFENGHSAFESDRKSKALEGCQATQDRRFSRPLNLPNRHPIAEVGTSGFSWDFSQSSVPELGVD